MSTIRCQVSASGHLDLPVQIRKALGVEQGEEVIVELTGQEVHVRSVNDVIEGIQQQVKQLLAGKPNVSVDAFIAERRGEASLAMRKSNR